MEIFYFVFGGSGAVILFTLGVDYGLEAVHTWRGNHPPLFQNVRVMAAKYHPIQTLKTAVETHRPHPQYGNHRRIPLS